jgi:hypothetical protein
MELNEVIEFIRNADATERSILKAELKQHTERQTISDLCAEDITSIFTALPRTDTTYKGYRYETTAATYARHIRDLANAITGNYELKHTNRGIPMWTGSDYVSPKHAENYHAAFHAMTQTVIELMKEYDTSYHSETDS